MPLFSDLPVNNNNTYSYDILEQDVYTPRPAVFMPTTIEKYSITRLEILKQPTFYKSFLTLLTTKFSIFVYYSLFPLYVYQEVAKINMRDMTTLVGCLSITSFLFTGLSHWINIDKKRRPICLWALCWVGAFGYFSKYFFNYFNFLLIFKWLKKVTTKGKQIKIKVSRQNTNHCQTEVKFCRP